MAIPPDFFPCWWLVTYIDTRHLSFRYEFGVYHLHHLRLNVVDSSGSNA